MEVLHAAGLRRLPRRLIPQGPAAGRGRSPSRPLLRRPRAVPAPWWCGRRRRCRGPRWPGPPRSRHRFSGIPAAARGRVVGARGFVLAGATVGKVLAVDDQERPRSSSGIASRAARVWVVGIVWPCRHAGPPCNRTDTVSLGMGPSPRGGLCRGGSGHIRPFRVRGVGVCCRPPHPGHPAPVVPASPWPPPSTSRATYGPARPSRTGAPPGRAGVYWSFSSRRGEPPHTPPVNNPGPASGWVVLTQAR